MSLLRAILVCALVLAGGMCQHAHGAEPPAYLMQYWTSDDGLPDSSVSAVVQTPDGYLWIGTYNGLVRFDGVRFTVFDPDNTPELKNARVMSLFTDARGTLWIYTYGGSMTSFRAGRFQHEWQGAQVVKIFSTTNRIYLATIASGIATRAEDAGASTLWQTLNFGAQGISARFFCQDASGIIWCLLRGGQIERIVGTNVMQLPGDVGLNGATPNCLTADPAGSVWVGTDKGIYRWNGQRFEDETPTNGEPSVAFSFLFCTATNGLWAFVNSNSVRHAANRKWTAGTTSWTDLTKAEPLYVQGYEDKAGNVWFRQFGHGLFCAGINGTFSRICSTNGLPDNRVSCWCQDHEDNLWVGMERGGLVKLRERQFRVVGGDLENVPVATVCEDGQSNVWIGTFDNGLNLWHDGRLDSFKLSEGANKSAFFSAYPDALGQIWLSADHEDLFVKNTNNIIRRVDSIHGIKAIFADSQGRIWLGRHNGLTCLDNGKTSNFNQRNGFARSTVRALAEDTLGDIWIGGDDGVLYKFSSGRFSPFKTDQIANAHAIWSLFADDQDTVWAGTFRGGLLRFKDGKFTRYTTGDGLPNDIICQIVDDGLGNLWFGSHKGIFYIPISSFGEFDRGDIKSLPCITFGLADGLPTLECSGGYQPSAWHGRDGKLCFATVKGAITVNPDSIQPNRLPPPVALEDVILDGKQIGITETQTVAQARIRPAISMIDHFPTLVIPPGKHNLDFEFTAMSFTASDKVRFRYQLVGFDNGWIDGGTKRIAHYGPLTPGSYKFRVIACNNDGVWNEAGASLNLTQRPFFWQTWWFLLLALLASGAAIAGAASYAVTRRLRRKLELLKQQRAIEIERERIARDIHDDLGAGLTQIMFQSSLGRNEPPERMKTDLSQISETARDLVRNMDEIVWAINPEHDTLDGLVTYLGKYVQDFVTAAKLRCRLDLPADLPGVSVPAETRHNVYLAIKEALNNVAKHAQATEVLFQLQLRNDAFAFIIRDNGIGVASESTDADAPSLSRISSGHGLRNLPRRLESVGGSCVVTSLQPGQGTEVEIVIPFRRNQNKTTRSNI